MLKICAQLLLWVMLFPSIIRDPVSPVMVNIEQEVAAVRLRCEYGLASYYHHKFNGRITASGERYYSNRMTAAHRYLPFGTKVYVTNLENNRVVCLIINDRGPLIDSRILDISPLAAKQLGIIRQGLVYVSIEVVKDQNIHTKA